MIIRRPHAYEFLRRHTSLLEDALRSRLTTDTDSGVITIDGSSFPIPGIVFLDAEGELRGIVPMMAADARERLLAMMKDLGG